MNQEKDMIESTRSLKKTNEVDKFLARLIKGKKKEMNLGIKTDKITTNVTKIMNA